VIRDSHEFLEAPRAYIRSLRQHGVESVFFVCVAVNEDIGAAIRQIRERGHRR
jgi:hypothetical protein